MRRTLHAGLTVGAATVVAVLGVAGLALRRTA